MELVDITVKELYHGTTKKASTYILTEGFKLPTWNFNSFSVLQDSLATLQFPLLITP